MGIQHHLAPQMGFASTSITSLQGLSLPLSPPTTHRLESHVFAVPIRGAVRLEGQAVTAFIIYVVIVEFIHCLILMDTIWCSNGC